MKLYRIWWMIVFVLSLLACSYLITKTWIKWKTDPVILSFEKEQIPIWKIPFPAVTICPVNKVLLTEYNYTDKFHNRDNLPENEYKKFWDISLVCNLDQYPEVEFNCNSYITDEEAINNIVLSSPTVEYTFLETKWQNIYQSASSLFKRKVTEEGLCFTFNDLAPEEIFHEGVYISRDSASTYNDYVRSDWTLEKGYATIIKKTDYPRRTSRDGITSGLTFILDSLKEDIDYVCGMPVTGFKIILHNPAEVPNAAQQYILIPANKKANIVIKPELTKTSVTLRSLPAETRKCYFSEEKLLRFFKIYTQSNCEIECTANITYQHCDCIPFYLPHTILELDMEKCSSTTEEERDRMESTREIYKECNCLPSCNSLEYNTEISQSEYYLLNKMLASKAYDEKFTKEMQEMISSDYIILSQVDIFFKESQFYALKRSEMYGQVDFLANVGGLLGLFMGFSLLSLLEIVYFLTIRIWFKCQDKSGA